MADRFSAQVRRETERRFLAAGDELRASLTYEAMMAVNDAEDSIRGSARRLRARADEAEAQLDAGLYLGSLNVAQAGEDLSEAITRRADAFKVLARTMTHDALAAAMRGEMLPETGEAGFRAQFGITKAGATA